MPAPGACPQARHRPLSAPTAVPRVRSCRCEITFHPSAKRPFHDPEPSQRTSSTVLRCKRDSAALRTAIKDQRMLTHPQAYFKLSPIERRLYEIARSGPQGGFRMNIEKLRRRVGSESDLKVFKQRLIAISKRKVPLPEYGLAVVNPRLARSLDARQP